MLTPLVLDLSQVHLTDEQFYQLCISNPEIALKRNAEGALIVMPPVGGNSGSRELELGADLTIWNPAKERCGERYAECRRNHRR
jgi:Uma2 family endonuclease